MPAAAVIPAPLAYTKVAAVKKLVVGYLSEKHDPVVYTTVCQDDQSNGLPISGSRASQAFFLELSVCSANCGATRLQIIYFEKIRALKAGTRLNALAWNNKTRPLASSRSREERFVGFGPR